MRSALAPLVDRALPRLERSFAVGWALRGRRKAWAAHNSCWKASGGDKQGPGSRRWLEGMSERGTTGCLAANARTGCCEKSRG